MRTRRTTHIELPVSNADPLIINTDAPILSRKELASLQRRVDELFQALRSQWQQGYEQCLIDNDIDPETYVQPTRAPWS
jgi:hypothetical protein